MISKKKARELTIKVWSYLRDHPEIEYKIALPEEIFINIMDMMNHCPLCEYIKQRVKGVSRLDMDFEFCSSCPLYLVGPNCCDRGSYYDNWSKAKTKKTRKKYASKIVKTVMNW